SEDAVIVPQSENQSRSNAGKVDAVGARTPPRVDAQPAQRALQESLAARIPKTVEAVDNFKRDRNAQHVGAEVARVAQADKGAVVSTFGDLAHTPPPAPAEHVSVPLTAEEGAPATPPMNLGRDAIAPLAPEHTDTSGYTRTAAEKLKEEGVTQQQLDMVDPGEL